MKTMIILRGSPGSGKSAFADLLSRISESGAILSLDHYRMVDGKYVFDPARERDVVKDYHDGVKKAIEHHEPLIILDNVHSRIWEYERTMRMGKDAGYRVYVVENQAEFMDCWQRQQHPVSWDKFVEIWERWETWTRVPDVKTLLKAVAQLLQR